MPAVHHTCKTFSLTLFKTLHTTSGILYQEDSNMKTCLYWHLSSVFFLSFFVNYFAVSFKHVGLYLDNDKTIAVSLGQL